MDTKELKPRFFEFAGPRRDTVPSTYRTWQNHARSLIEPLVVLMEEGKAQLDIEGMASDHDANADRLEALARPLVLFCHWERSTQVYQDERDAALLEKSKAWFKDALLLGSDPVSDQFFGYSANFHQHSVEMGLMVIGLELSRDWFWDELQDAERERILSWLESDVGNGHHWNNHMFFGIFVLEFLQREGRRREAYRGVVNRWFEELEGMYADEGWYMDGMNQAFDFYNAYAWHYYSMWWVGLYGESDTRRCERFKARTYRFLQDYPTFFAKSGEHPAFGRSIAYRFNATAPFGLAQAMGALPMEGSKARGLCQRSLEFFLSKPISQDQGCLSLGWYDEFLPMVEVYSTGGSPYWAAKAFSPLLLSPDDTFWQEDAAASVSEESNRVVALKAPCLIVRQIDGEAEIINAGSQIASTNTRFGPHKWGRLSYKSAWGFALAKEPSMYPFDGGLTAQKMGSEVVYGRHYTAPFAIEEELMGCLYSLGGKLEQFQVSVETRVWWKGNWHLIVHRVLAKDAATLRHGSYALPISADQEAEIKDGFPFPSASNGKQSVAVQAVCGFTRSAFDKRLNDEEGPRRHIQTPYHATALLETELGANETRDLAVLNWAGIRSEEGQAWRLDSLEKGAWAMSHPVHGKWNIEDESLRKVSE
ncbi:DUF2264 domain-containing protein [Pelagicoccus sp. SDUM812002]|uniref:DUF2264 domain-containing protein n=1 Tax=Pelagicoccus sp. SDUM812002 TaxID=3041266 RepID=UPI00280E01C5|nr:DUF2264 domain-containing protein [Pelagicoccus sp. SDUM812002]MDQ8186748.1 DUF2264 domain-containing protein [Pelagicoccus sp. SDUM812002]